MAGHSIFGIYTSRQGVEAAVQALRDANFRSSDISVLAPENLGDIRDIATVKSTKAPEGATAGGTSGAVVGGVLGWLVGIGALAHPRHRTFARGWSHYGRTGRSRRRRGCRWTDWRVGRIRCAGV